MLGPVKYILLILICCSGLNTYAQHVEFVRGNFPGKNAAFNVAYKHYRDGEKSFTRIRKDGTGNYEAIDLILQPAYAFNPNHEKLNYMLGVCKFEQAKYEDALGFFNYAETLSLQHDSTIYYYQGLTEHILMQYDSAITHLQYYLTHYAGNRGFDSIASKRIEECKYGAILVRNKVHTKSEPLPAVINSGFSEFLAIPAPDLSFIIFNRKIPDPLHANRYTEKILISYASTNGWSEPEDLPLNNLMKREFNAVSLSSDGNKLLLRSKDKNGNYDLYETVKGSLGWGPPTMLPSEINSVHDEPYAVYADHDQTIYVISNRSRGYGGYDIWKSVKTSEYTWSKVKNIGSSINTSYNEMFVSVPADSTVIYFTSDGHASVGYTDIFRSRMDNGKWQRPVNLGYPVNSSLPDTEFRVMPSGMVGILTKLANGQSDLLKVNLPPKAKSPALIFDEILHADYSLILTETIIPQDD